MNGRSGRRNWGSVRRIASGRWQARYRDDAGHLQSAPRTFVSKGDASRWLSTVEVDRARGEWLDPRLGATHFDAFVAEWLPTMVHLRPTTRVSYEYLLRVHLSPTFGDIAIGRITPSMVQVWRADLLTSGLAPNSVAKAYRLLARVMTAAVRGRYIGHTPCLERGAGTDEVPEMRFATAAQVDAIAARVPERDRALIYVAAYSSLRMGELAGLRRRDVNPLHKTVTVARQITEVRGQLHVGPPKTASSKRTVRLPDLVAAILNEHLQRHSEAGPDGLVFPAAEGGPLRRSNFRRRVWVPATQAAGVPGLRFHDLRHTGATLAAASGAPLKALMQRMGHSTVGAALRYQHVVDGQQDAIADYLDGVARTAISDRESQSEPDACGTFVARKAAGDGTETAENAVTSDNDGGRCGVRTHDPLLVREVLFQLS